MTYQEFFDRLLPLMEENFSDAMPKEFGGMPWVPLDKSINSKESAFSAIATKAYTILDVSADCLKGIVLRRNASLAYKEIFGEKLYDEKEKFFRSTGGKWWMIKAKDFYKQELEKIDEVHCVEIRGLGNFYFIKK